MGFIIIVALLVFGIWLVKSLRGNIPQIHKCKSVKDVVMSINHGRIYPFYTRMNLARAKSAAKAIHPNVTKFEQEMQMYELMGLAPYFSLPVSNDYIERISVMFNKKGLVSSIGIDIKNFDANMKPLVEAMVAKFGKPMSMDNEFIIWRESYMVINISVNGSLSVIDEGLFGK